MDIVLLQSGITPSSQNALSQCWSWSLIDVLLHIRGLQIHRKHIWDKDQFCVEHSLELLWCGPKYRQEYHYHIIIWLMRFHIYSWHMKCYEIVWHSLNYVNFHDYLPVNSVIFVLNLYPTLAVAILSIISCEIELCHSLTSHIPNYNMIHWDYSWNVFSRLSLE